MHEVTPELREKFLEFLSVYEASRSRLIERAAAGHIVASVPWKAALEAVPLTDEELKLYKILVAMHSVNGGELFGNAEPEGPEADRESDHGTA